MDGIKVVAEGHRKSRGLTSTSMQGIKDLENQDYEQIVTIIEMFLATLKTPNDQNSDPGAGNLRAQCKQSYRTPLTQQAATTLTASLCQLKSNLFVQSN